ncbi:hypothetical protein C7R88_01350 [Plesiomonas shigelloides]|nr:hypothetical protein C7R88_01350 [Plesiomonas shigelloides]
MTVSQKISHFYPRRTLPIVGWLMCALLSGCASRGFTGFEVAQQPLVLADAALSEQVNVQSYREGFGQPLRVGIQLQNRQAQPLTLEYRLYWYDAQGIELDNDPTPWQQVTLSAHQVWTTRVTAQEPQATSYRLHVRPLSKAASLPTGNIAP